MLPLGATQDVGRSFTAWRRFQFLIFFDRLMGATDRCELRQALCLLQSLPAEEQELFRRHRHPAQDGRVVGFQAAKAAASALQTELVGHAGAVSVEVHRGENIWLLALNTTAQAPAAGKELPTAYQGFLVVRCKKPGTSTR